jgi:hypothetical protein
MEFIMRSRHWSDGANGKQDAHAQIEAIQQDVKQMAVPISEYQISGRSRKLRN